MLYQPELYFDEETKDAFAGVIMKDYSVPQREPDVVDVSNGYILPAIKISNAKGQVYYQGGVVSAQKVFETNSIYWRKNNEGALLEDYDFDEEDVKVIDKEVVYGGMLINHFGHFITEGTSRLWYWAEHADKKLDIAFLMQKNQKIFPQFWEIMALMGIKKSKIHFIKRPTRFKKIYVPAQSHILGVSYDEKMKVPYEFMSQNLPGKEKQKVYISRTKFKKGTPCFGEKDIETVYKNNGWTIVYPERLSVKKQAILMKNASEIAGVSGTGLHMALFADEGTKITVLERTDVPDAEQSIVNQAAKLESVHIGVNMNPFPVDHSIGPTLLGITENFKTYIVRRGFSFDKSLVNKPSVKFCKKFIKEYMKAYTQTDNNRALSKVCSLTAHRLLCMSEAFIPLRKKIKQTIKQLKKKK